MAHTPTSLSSHCREQGHTLADSVTPVRIVIVDDHPLFVAGIRNALCSEEDLIVVGEASNGTAAVRMVTEAKPDLLLLDDSLPGLSGLDVLRELARSGAHPFTILLESRIDHKRTVDALDLGVRGVLTKDATREVLISAIRAVMQGEYWVRRGALTVWALTSRRDRALRSKLTDREREVLQHAVDGLTNREIAAACNISEETVKRHITHIYEKFGVSNRVELAKVVLRVDDRTAA